MTASRSFSKAEVASLLSSPSFIGAFLPKGALRVMATYEKPQKKRPYTLQSPSNDQSSDCVVGCRASLRQGTVTGSIRSYPGWMICQRYVTFELNSPHFGSLRYTPAVRRTVSVF